MVPLKKFYKLKKKKKKRKKLHKQLEPQRKLPRQAAVPYFLYYRTVRAKPYSFL